MSISLPPGTSDFNQTGTLVFRIAPIYINSSLPSIKYSLKLWGFTDEIGMQKNEDSLNNNSMFKSQRMGEGYERVFRATTNLSKLTNYFRDMAVMIIVVADARTNKQIGLGYVKMKQYIINDLLSQFEQKVEIVAHCQNKYKKLVIGEIVLKLKLDVPVNAITTKTNLINPTTSEMQIDMPDIPRNDRMNISKRNKRMEDQFRAHQEQQHKMTEREGHMRKIVIQPNIFDEHQTNPQLKQFTISKHARGAENRVIVPRQDEDRDNDMRDMLMAMRTKPKVTKENVLDFLEHDSINAYPDIEELTRKYGHNNVCVERMKLRFDQAKYLGRKQRQSNTHQITTENRGFLIAVRNVHHLISMAGPNATDFNVVQLVSDKDNVILNKFFMKQLNEAGFYVKQISAGNVIDFDNKLYKARVVIKNNNIQGQPHKVYLKRKDNNKKIAEFDVKIQNLSLNGLQEHNDIEKKQIKRGHEIIKNKVHFYVSIRPVNENKYKQFTYEIHPQNQKQGAKGRKIIFTSDNITQQIKIRVKLIDDQQIRVAMDPSIKMKEQNVWLHDQQFKIFMASADGIENLMKMVVLYDSNIKSAPSVNEPESRGSRIVTPGQTPEVQTQRNSKQVDDKYKTRQDKLKLLYECLECLIQTNNTECMQVIKKLSSPTITHDQQLPLFQRLCVSAGTTQPQATTFLAFKQLLHGEFSMFWKCFEEYKLWNQMYAHALRLSYKQAQHNLLACIGQLSGDVSGYYNRKHQKQGIKIMQKLIDKLYRHRQTLFGLIPYQACKIVIHQYVNDHFKPSAREGEPIIKRQTAEIAQVEDHARIKQKHENSGQRLQVLKQSLSHILCLLCRYTGSDNETHSIKIEELAAVLLTSPQQYNIPINQHQIFALSDGGRQQMQLLFEVTCSCVDQKMSREGCKHLKELLDFYEKVKTEVSSLAEEEQRISTQGNNTLHMYTEQPQRIQTEEIQQNKKQPTPVPQNIARGQQIEQKQMKLYLKQLVLNPDRGQYATIASTKNAVVEILDSDTKVCKYKVSPSDLPKAINVINMKDYLVVVSLHDEQLDPGADVLEGVFIANSTMDRILLYSSQKGGDAKDVGYISTAFEPDHTAIDDDDVIVIELTNEVSIPAHRQHEYNKIYIEQISKQMEEEERNRLTKQVRGKVIEQKKIAYKILNAYPAPRSTQEYLILLEGADRTIRYPNYYATGSLNNQDANQQSLRIVLQYPNSGAKFEQKLAKSAGVHDVCFNKSDGSVGCVLSVQLSQYIGQQATSMGESAIQRLIYMNIYHMELFAKLSLLYEDKRNKFTIVVTSQSNVDPVFVKQFDIYSKSPCRNRQDDALRHIWIGLTTKVQASKSFDICIYSNSRGGKYLQDNLIAHFVFKMKYHPQQVGIFENKGYLIDEHGFRLALTMIEINYNDIFSKDEVGREKFQNLLSVFTTENILKINQSSPQTSQQLKSKIRSHFGFNNTQIYLLFELQSHGNQILNMITNWDVGVLLSEESINLQAYSIQDLFTQYQIYDFTNCGMIPYSKAQLVDILVFKSKDKTHRVNIQKCLTDNKDGWLIDLKSKQKDGDIDYILILWCLRKFAIADDFFIKGTYDHSTSKEKHKNTLNDTTQNNNTSLPQNNQDSISKIKAVKVELLCFKNLKVDGQPATLTFYLNGQKVAEPVPRCFTCEYQQPKTIVTTWPIVLEIYNKKYGVRQLFTEQLVGTVKVYQQKVHVLGGQIYFLIEEEGAENSLMIPRPGKGKIDDTKQKQDLNNTNRFRQSRRQKWQNLKESRSDTQKIADILSRVTA